MTISYFIKKDDEPCERFLIKIETNTVPYIGARVMFQDFDKIDELNVYKVINVDYVYTVNELKPTIDIILSPLKML